ncbi:hypothetical protein F4810DRAFT_705314 [Camillea tinctor]|nr:hypothetical protein F4810DRAFT_705314 [Camillea tinctor]
MALPVAKHHFVYYSAHTVANFSDESLLIEISQIASYLSILYLSEELLSSFMIEKLFFVRTASLFSTRAPALPNTMAIILITTLATGITIGIAPLVASSCRTTI